MSTCALPCRRGPSRVDMLGAHAVPLGVVGQWAATRPTLSQHAHCIPCHPCQWLAIPCPIVLLLNSFGCTGPVTCNRVLQVQQCNGWKVTQRGNVRKMSYTIFPPCNLLSQTTRVVIGTPMKGPAHIPATRQYLYRTFAAVEGPRGRPFVTCAGTPLTPLHHPPSLRIETVAQQAGEKR